MKPTPEGQRALAEHARRIAEMLAPKNLSTAMLFQRIARAHDAEATRIEKLRLPIDIMGQSIIAQRIQPEREENERRSHELDARVVHVSAGPLEPQGYVRCLPSGAVHPAGECRVSK